MNRYTASVFPVYNGKVLLIKHKKLNLWLPPGGKLDEGETPLQGARRELYEETGLVGVYPTMKGEPEGTPPGFLGYEEHWITENELHMNFCFMCYVKTDEVAADGSFSEHRWVTLEEALQLGSTGNVLDLIRKIDALV